MLITWSMFAFTIHNLLVIQHTKIGKIILVNPSKIWTEKSFSVDGPNVNLKFLEAVKETELIVDNTN